MKKSKTAKPRKERKENAIGSLLLGHTIKSGTPEHRTTERRTPTEQWPNTGTMAEYGNTGGTMEH